MLCHFVYPPQGHNGSLQPWPTIAPVINRPRGAEFLQHILRAGEVGVSGTQSLWSLTQLHVGKYVLAFPAGPIRPLSACQGRYPSCLPILDPEVLQSNLRILPLNLLHGCKGRRRSGLMLPLRVHTQSWHAVIYDSKLTITAGVLIGSNQMCSVQSKLEPRSILELFC